MTFHFENAEAKQRLRNAAAIVDGTPFAKFSEAPGRTGGMSCIRNAKWLFVQAGAIRDVDFPETDADYENHAFGDRFVSWMRGEVDDPVSHYMHERFAEIRMPDLMEIDLVRGMVMVGDLIVLQHKQLVHLPVVLNDELPFEIISALPRIGVRIGTLQDTTFKQHFRALFRARAI